MAPANGLRATQMSVSRQQHFTIARGGLGKSMLNGLDVRDHEGDCLTNEQAEIGGNLIVAAATGVQLRADLARDLGDAPFDRGVDVLVARRGRARGLEPSA